jgi:hypothetical protein
VRLQGNVSSVSSGSLVLTTRAGDVTANIGENTFIVVQKNSRPAQGTAADLVTGKPAVVVGVATSDPAVVDARLISQGPRVNAGQAARRVSGHVAAGTIKSISGDTITLQGVRVPDVIVNTAASTVVLNNGFTTVSSLKVGDRVAVLGAPVRPSGTASGNRARPPQTRTLNAWALRVESPTTRLSFARVDSINGDTLTVKTLRNRDDTTVLLDANTAYRALSISPTDRTATLAPATRADIQPGSRLVIEGIPGADGKSATAVAVIILPAANPR